MKSCFLFLVLAATASAQRPENVLVVVNSTSQVSRDVGEYYRQKRNIPAGQVCTISAPAIEEIDRDTYNKRVRNPVGECLTRGGLQERILYIVLTKGVPLVVQGSGGRSGEVASVDSELTLLYQELKGVKIPVAGKMPSPYYRRNSRGQDFARFSHPEFPMYLVTRLDGYDLKEVKALVDRGMSPKREGVFVLDCNGDADMPGDNWLREAAVRLRAAGVPESSIVLETTKRFLIGAENVLGYASWGSNDKSDRSRYLQHKWVNGALLAEFVSTDARSFERPPENWNIGSWKDDRKTFFKDSRNRSSPTICTRA